MSLQHQALIAHSKSNKFDANNVQVMNILFEMDGERMRMTEQMEDYRQAIKHLRRDLVYDVITIDPNIFIRATELKQRIETILFDNLRYKCCKEAQDNPDWTEYYHALYSYFIVPIGQKMAIEEVRNAKTSCQMYRTVRRPGNNPPGPLTHMLDRLFIAMRIEYKQLPDMEDMVNNRMIENVNTARELVRVEKEYEETVDKFEDYDDVVAWSLM